MASPFSGLVLAAGAAITSPTLYGAFVAGTVPVEDALLRLVVVVALTTVAVTLVEWVFHGTSPVAQGQLDAAREAGMTGPKGAVGEAAPPGSGGSAAADSDVP